MPWKRQQDTNMKKKDTVRIPNTANMNTSKTQKHQTLGRDPKHRQHEQSSGWGLPPQIWKSSAFHEFTWGLEKRKPIRQQMNDTSSPLTGFMLYFAEVIKLLMVKKILHYQQDLLLFLM
jgi:hypothetical protein